jgi:hypothetical protein
MESYWMKLAPPITTTNPIYFEPHGFSDKNPTNHPTGY